MLTDARGEGGDVGGGGGVHEGGVKTARCPSFHMEIHIERDSSCQCASVVTFSEVSHTSGVSHTKRIPPSLHLQQPRTRVASSKRQDSAVQFDSVISCRLTRMRSWPAVCALRRHSLGGILSTGYVENVPRASIDGCDVVVSAVLFELSVKLSARM